MTPAPAFTIPTEVVIAKLTGEVVLLHLDTKNYYRLNETGAVVWSVLERGADASAATEALLQQYEIDRNTAEAAVDTLLEALVERNLIERCS